MEIFRYSRDAFGQSVMQGASWDLLWLFIGIPAVIIAGHFLYKLVKKDNTA